MTKKPSTEKLAVRKVVISKLQDVDVTKLVGADATLRRNVV